MAIQKLVLSMIEKLMIKFTVLTLLLFVVFFYDLLVFDLRLSVESGSILEQLSYKNEMYRYLHWREPMDVEHTSLYIEGIIPIFYNLLDIDTIAESVVYPKFDIYIEYSTIRALTADAVERNSDVVGWIYIPNTRINYPVLFRAGESNFYLYHDFYGQRSSSGAIYLDDSSNGKFGSLNLIHGHSMRNGTRFRDLLNFRYQSWADARPIIYLFDGDAVREYEVFAVTLFNANNERLVIRFSSDLERDRYFSRMIGRSLIAPREVVNPDDILVLNTCSYEADNFRLLVFSSRVRKDGR